jgi:2-hydroxy-3-keto-5-methylthiopentenyl-1-phosphate phosphatase
MNTEQPVIEYAVSVPLVIILHTLIFNDKLMEYIKNHPNIPPPIKSKLQILCELLNDFEPDKHRRTFPSKDVHVVSYYMSIFVSVIYQNNAGLKELAHLFLESMLGDVKINEQHKIQMADISKTIHNTFDLILKLGKPPKKILAVVDTAMNGGESIETIRIKYFP